MPESPADRASAAPQAGRDPTPSRGDGTPAGDVEAELVALRRGVRDLAAVTLLHGLWDGREVRDIADGLCGTVYRLLDLDVAAVRVEAGPDGAFVVAYPAGATDAESLIEEVRPKLSQGITMPPGVIGHQVDLDGIRAIVVGRTNRPAFPSEVEALIFRAVANEASVAVRASRRMDAASAARRTLEAVIEQMPIGVAIADAASGRVVARNATLERLIGSLASRLDGSGDPAAIDAPPGPPVDDVAIGPLVRRLHAHRPGGGPRYAPDAWPLRRSLRSGEVVTDEEIDLILPGGPRMTLSISSAPVRDATGAIVAAVATLADISARREADSVRDAFISMLSHELRTPITTIYAGAHLLRRPTSSQRPDDRREIIEDIAVEAERLDRIVQNFLVLARVDRGATVRGHEPVLVQRLVPRLIEREHERWPDRTFTTDLPPDLPPVAADESSLELVVRNLVNNAAKYGGSGARIEVVGRYESEGVRLEVLDDGPGLTDPDLGHVFELFYRSKRLAPAAEGAGVGLYVVRAAVEAMGGTTWATARPDRGACFGFSLPAWREEPLADEGPAVEVPAAVGLPTVAPAEAV